jgi:hypothetical protein
MGRTVPATFHMLYQFIKSALRLAWRFKIKAKIYFADIKVLAGNRSKNHGLIMNYLEADSFEESNPRD